jgi:hypothetical protein
MTATLVPFGVKAPAPTFVVTIDPSAFAYDEERAHASLLTGVIS